jgi:hypothetical protein
MHCPRGAKKEEIITRNRYFFGNFYVLILASQYQIFKRIDWRAQLPQPAPYTVFPNLDAGHLKTFLRTRAALALFVLAAHRGTMNHVDALRNEVNPCILFMLRTH